MGMSSRKDLGVRRPSRPGRGGPKSGGGRCLDFPREGNLSEGPADAMLALPSFRAQRNRSLPIPSPYHLPGHRQKLSCPFCWEIIRKPGFLPPNARTHPGRLNILSSPANRAPRNRFNPLPLHQPFPAPSSHRAFSGKALPVTPTPPATLKRPNPCYVLWAVPLLYPQADPCQAARRSPARPPCPRTVWIGVGMRDRTSPLPPNRTCGSPASGSPVSALLPYGDGWLQTWLVPG